MSPESPYYPALLRLEGRRCLVVGGGVVACRKVRSLREAGARVHVVSPELCAPLRRMEGVVLHRRPYRKSDLRGAALVISATDHEAVNRRVAREAVAAGIPVNVVDQPALCSFIVPASFRRGRLTITVSTGGASPALAAAIRRRLERLFGKEYSRLLEALAAVRAEAFRTIKNPKTRSRVLLKLASPPLLNLAKRLSTRELRREMLKLVTRTPAS